MTSFQSECYEALKKIPAGNVISYGGLAEMIGRPNAHRAVGSAMNKNPFAPTVPCHRAVKSNGELGGFADDISVKIKRLHEEGESNTYETHPQHGAVDVDSVVTIDKTKSKSNHTFIVDTGWAYYGRILKKVTEDDVMAEMEKLPPAR